MSRWLSSCCARRDAAHDRPAGFALGEGHAISGCCAAPNADLGAPPMPLSPPVPREPSHTRAIVINGYRRSDGLFDIEAQLTDTKSYGFTNEDRGYIASGVPLHGMWMRMTVAEDMTVVACEAASDHTPYAICPTAAPNFARLAGLRITRGFLREANMRIGGTHGCTHLRELLQQMATTAFQTINPHRAKRAVD